MTKVFDNPAEFRDDQMRGFTALYADRLLPVAGGVVSFRDPKASPRVAVVVGGGSGHYPAFCGLVGPGLASAAVVGNIFSSPSAAQAYSVAKAANQGLGVIISYGNYAGDNLNFGIAAARLNREGVPCRLLVVTDDVASSLEVSSRRGIAGDFAVFKVLGAAAAAGLGLDEVERVGRKANSATFTLGVAFSGCNLPGADNPLFEVPKGYMGLGLGIHGEPGIRDIPLQSAQDLARTFTSSLLKDRPDQASKAAVILNGLGSTKYEELFLLWGLIQENLTQAGVEAVEAEVGELVTSLDMGGCSLTLMWLDDELERYWRADAYTPAYKKVTACLNALRRPSSLTLGQPQAQSDTTPIASKGSRRLADELRGSLNRVYKALVEAEPELGRIDAVAGDGDHGRGMVMGAEAGLKAAEALPHTAGAGLLLIQVGRAWAAEAGGTSGVLWGAGLEAAGAALDDTALEITPLQLLKALEEFAHAIIELGGAQAGDKTLLDALLPFVNSLKTALVRPEPFVQAWQQAVDVAKRSAQDTAPLRPKRGRAKPLADRSVGTPDAGAVSLALILSQILPDCKKEME